MADTKISGLTAIDAPVAGDLLVIVDDPGGTPTTKKMTVSQLIDDTAYDASSWNGSVLAPTKNAVRDKIEAVVAASAVPAFMVLTKTAVDFNSGNTDNAIAVTLPTGFTRFIVNQVRISGASASLTTATFGVFTAAAGGGTAVVASGTACTVSTASADSTNNAQNCSIFANNNNTAFGVATVPNLYFRVQTAQGSAATGNVTVSIVPLP